MAELSVKIVEGKAYLQAKTFGNNNGLGALFHVVAPLEVGEHPEVVKYNEKIEKQRQKQLELEAKKRKAEAEVESQMQIEFKKLEQQKFEKLQSIRDKVQKKMGL